MLKQQHYTLTNVKKVKSQSTTPLTDGLESCCFTCGFFMFLSAVWTVFMMAPIQCKAVQKL